MGITLRTEKEIEALRAANRIVVDVLHLLRDKAEPGMSTMDLENLARKQLRKTDAKPAFLGYRGFPAVICASVNEEVVHGIPSEEKVLAEGDILSVDFGVELNGYYGDAAMTIPLGEVDEEKKRLMDATRDSLDKAIGAMVVDNHLSDIAEAVQSHAEGQGFSVVYQFVGHGIGRRMHEDPQVPNCGRPRPNARLREGMVLAVEPMVNAGVPEVKVLGDGWTAVTADGRPSAHFERSIAIGKDGPKVLSEWQWPGRQG